MRKTLLTITIIMIMILAGCSNDEPEIQQTQENPVKDKPTIILKEEEPEPEPVIYGLGERAVVREDFAVTILSVEDTEYKIPWRPKQKNIVVEVLFENLSMDENHEVFHYETGLVTGFNLSVHNADPYPPAVLDEAYGHVFTPAGTKSVHKLVFEAPEHPSEVRLRFSDYLNEDLMFNVEKGKRVEADLTGSLPEPEKVYGKGEPMVITKAAKDYLLTVQAVRRLEPESSESGKEMVAEYEVELLFLNMDIRRVMNRNFQLTFIDDQGNTSYTNVYSYPEETDEGVKVSMFFTANAESDKVMLHYTDSLLDRDEAFYILIDDIEE